MGLSGNVDKFTDSFSLIVYTQVSSSLLMLAFCFYRNDKKTTGILNFYQRLEIVVKIMKWIITWPKKIHWNIDRTLPDFFFISSIWWFNLLKRCRPPHSSTWSTRNMNKSIFFFAAARAYVKTLRTTSTVSGSLDSRSKHIFEMTPIS